jgi:predicted enzyme related to lactoylglutathione lyase
MISRNLQLISTLPLHLHIVFELPSSRKTHCQHGRVSIRIPGLQRQSTTPGLSEQEPIKLKRRDQIANVNTAAVPGKSTISFTEIPVFDGERAVAFYSAVLGWEFHPEFSGLPNHSVETSAVKRVWCFSVGHRVLGALHKVDPEYAVMLALEAGSKKIVMRTSWNVDDIDETTAKVLANGGKVHL